MFYIRTIQIHLIQAPEISRQSPVGSHQTLKVYNLLGSEVATLVDEDKPAGTYEIEFNAEQSIQAEFISIVCRLEVLLRQRR